MQEDSRALAKPGLGGGPSAVGERGEGTILAENVTKEFEGGVRALDDVDLSARPGEFVSIVGPSGCGKSTMLRLIAGLIPLSGGTITVNGRQVTEPRQDIALMFQRPTLLPWQTALQNVLLPPKLGKNLDQGAERQAYELLDLVGLSGFEHTYPRHLSGGMQQRVALARLLMVGVDVLLLDEPFAAVDQLTRERLNLELLRVHERLSATALLVTHNIQEATLLADRVIVMTPRPGRIADVIDVPLPRPRAPEMLAEPEFQELVLRAYSGLQIPLVDEGDTRQAGVNGA
ncbi:MAG: transporter related protein [Solirubrobacterales bacterium]|nr:transporter related protein [Solirubrobacterales bacterium]